jgi:hypothetical protein
MKHRANIKYYHLLREQTFKRSDIDRLAYCPDLIDFCWFSPYPAPPPEVNSALIIPYHTDDVRILRIVGTHRLDPRWSCKDPAFARSLRLEPRLVALRPGAMEALDDPSMSQIYPSTPVSIPDEWHLVMAERDSKLEKTFYKSNATRSRID